MPGFCDGIRDANPVGDFRPLPLLEKPAVYMDNVKMRIFPAIISAILFLCLPAFGQDVRNIVIDPGHGGYETGVSLENTKEKDFSLALAKALSERLKENRKKADLTRTVDRHMTIEERSASAESHRPDVFISIHAADTGRFTFYISRIPGAEASGADQYAASGRQREFLEQSRELARTMADVLKEEFKLDAALRELPLGLLNSMGAPAVLIEIPFRGLDPEGDLTRLSYAIAQGIKNYEQQ